MLRDKNKRDNLKFFGVGFFLGVLLVVFIYTSELKIYGYISSGDGLGRLKSIGKKLLVDAGILRKP